MRKDLYAVKQYQSVGKKSDWVVVLVTKDLQIARNEKRFRESDRMRSFPLMEIPIVHPSQKTVDAWLSVGNVIN